MSYKNGIIKGNWDAEFVLQTMTEYDNFENAVIVTGDGDFYCLVIFLLEKEKLETVLVPNSKKYSVLLKRFRKKKISFMDNFQPKLEYKKRPHRDGALQRTFRGDSSSI